MFDEDARRQHDIFDGAKFSANPFADPKMWAWAAKSPGLFSDTWKAGVADLFDSVRQARSQKSDAVKTAAIADLGRGVFRSMDKEWRILADRYKSKTMDDIRTMFHAIPDVGRGGAVETTYHEGILEHGQGNLNKVADIFKPLISTVGSFTKLTVGRDKTALNQVVKLVENPRNIKPGTPIHDAAAALRKLLDENHTYLKDAGVDIGKIDGYFPHMLKSDEVRRNPDQFVSMAAREMMANKASTGVANMAEATKRAEAWRDNIMLAEVGVTHGGMDFIKLGHMPNADFAKERVLIQKSPEFFNRFYHTDPVDSLSTFFNRTAHRAEWAKRMGDSNEVWASLKDKMIAEGNAAALPQLVDLVAKSAGISPVAVSNTTRAVVGWTKTWGSLATMPLAWLSSISETGMPAVRAGRPLQVVGDIAKMGASMMGKLEKEKSLGSDLGLIANGYGDTLLGQRFGLDGAGKVRTWLHNAFFKATLLEGLTHNQMAVAINSAQAFVRRLGLDVVEKGDRAVLSKKLLAELGVSDHAGFSDWVSRQSEGRPTVEDTRDGSTHAQSYRTAIIRFANQTIMRPNPQTFTRFSQHPVGGLIQQLQSFNYAFTNNVLARLKNLAVESIRPGSGLNGTERLAAWGPILAMIPLMGIAGSVSEGRDQLFKKPGSQPMTDSERAMRVVSRSGLTGTLDPYINLITSARYRSEAATALGGPVVGKILHDGVDAGRGMLPKSMGGPNSPSTNSAERQLAQSTYDLIVSPLVTAATLPLPAAIRTPLIQGLKLGEVRGAAVDEMVGPRKVTAAHPASFPKPPKPASPARH